MLREVKAAGKDITLVGTAHVSKQSIKLVKETIQKKKPDSVAVELCEARYKALKDHKKWQETNVSTIIKEGKAYLFLVNLILSNFQRKIGKEIGVKPGAEMIEAVKVAEEHDADVVLADRDIQITLKRAFALMSLKEKFKIAVTLIGDTFAADIDEEVIEQLKDKDILTEVIEGLAKEAPSVKKVLIDERDIYLAQKIVEAKGKKVVAVVGAGHVEGIAKKLQQKKKSNLKKLEIVPKKKSMLKIVKWGIPILFVLLLGYGFFTKGAGVTFEMLMWWFLINGTLSAIGTAAAFGHPYSIVSAFLAAPFTSLNPMVAAGWVAGYVEASVRKPKVKDFERLNRLDKLRDYWKNSVTRVLLVVVFANLGSTIGTVIALPYLMSLLG